MVHLESSKAGSMDLDLMASEGLVLVTGHSNSGPLLWTDLGLLASQMPLVNCLR